MNSHVNDPHILYTDFRLNNLAASDSITYNTVSKHTYNGCNKKNIHWKCIWNDNLYASPP